MILRRRIDPLHDLVTWYGLDGDLVTWYGISHAVTQVGLGHMIWSHGTELAML